MARLMHFVVGVAILIESVTLCRNHPYLNLFMLSVLTVALLYLTLAKYRLSTGVANAVVNASVVRGQSSAQNVTTFTLNGRTMKRIGALVIFDVPDEIDPFDAQEVLEDAIGEGLSLSMDERAEGFNPRRLVILSDQHREAFERCLTPEDSS